MLAQLGQASGLLLLDHVPEQTHLSNRQPQHDALQAPPDPGLLELLPSLLVRRLSALLQGVLGPMSRCLCAGYTLCAGRDPPLRPDNRDAIVLPNPNPCQHRHVSQP